MDLSVYEKVYKLYKQGYWFFKGRNKIILNVLSRAYGNSFKEIKVLDIGCSTGIITKDLLSKGFNIFGIDIEDKALEYCVDLGLGSRIIKADIYNLPVSPGSFDCVTAFDVIEHLDEVRTLQTIKRVLKPKGRVLLTCPAHQWLWSRSDVAYHHRKRYSESGLVTLLEDNGFLVEKCSFFNFFLFWAFILFVILEKYATRNHKLDSLKPIPFFLNFILSKLMFLEAALIDKINLPFGSSIICLAALVN